LGDREVYQTGGPMVLSEAAVASLITAGGGVIAAIVAWFLSKGKTKTDFAIQLRNELREDIKRWKDSAEGFEKRANELYKEIDEWRERYNVLEEKCERISDENEDLKKENTRLSGEVVDLHKQIDALKINPQ
jgi:predicted RNase H-like nuclease (RuvC/YqgF family)